jgi:hypothetical protein
VKTDDDYYYRAKPAERIALRQSLSPEARGYASTYEDQMHLRGQPLPDERTRDGMEWHKTVMGVRSARTIARAVKELLDKGWLMRLQDGRLVNAEVERERASRAAAKKRQGGGGNSGSGGAGAPPRQGMLEVIDGGKAPQPAVDKPVEQRGEAGDGAGEAGNSRPIAARFPGNSRPNLRKFPNEIKGRALSSIERVSQRAVVAVGVSLPRARGDPIARA